MLRRYWRDHAIVSQGLIAENLQLHQLTQNKYEHEVSL